MKGVRRGTTNLCSPKEVDDGGNHRNECQERSEFAERYCCSGRLRFRFTAMHSRQPHPIPQNMSVSMQTWTHDELDFPFLILLRLYQEYRQSLVFLSRKVERIEI